MLILFLIIIPAIFIIIKLFLYLIVMRFGKFSYDGFSAAGFQYNAKKDIFYSTKNAWQKNFGYTHAYDVYAPIFRMIVDTEPIRFYYNNKNWLITFWKGQYGIVTGAEIGIYSTSQARINKKTIYMPANEDEMLNMELILYKKGKIITKVKAKHWWLAVFKLGMFSKPKELSMDVSLTFPNREMLESFLKSFKRLGYKEKDYHVIGNTFSFKFIKPKTRKVWTRIWLFDVIRQFYNRKNAELYNKYLGDLIDDNRVDDYKTDNSDLILINDYIPEILKNKKAVQSNNIAPKEEAGNLVILDSNIYSKLK